MLLRMADGTFITLGSSYYTSLVAFYDLGVTNGLCEYSRACRALLFFCEHEQKLKICFASLRATQKFGEHEQASTRLNFASKSNKGKILRAVKNFNGPFITPRPPSAKLRQWWPSREQATKNCGLANLSSVWMPRWRIFRQFSLRFRARLLSVSLIVDPPERASRHTSSTQLCTIRGRPENEVVRRVNLVPRAFTRLPSRSLIFCYISMNGMLEHRKALSP